MKKILAIALFLGLAISVQPAFASEDCQVQKMFDQLRSTSDVVIDDQAHEVDTRLLFLRLPHSPPAGTRVEVDFLRGGQSLVREIIVLTDEGNAERNLEAPGDAQPSVIEILSTSAAELARVRKLLEGGEVSVQVRLDGELVDTLSLRQLVERSDDLRQSESLPRAIAPRLAEGEKQFGARGEGSALTEGACENACYAQEDYCYDQCVWVPNSTPCFAACDEALDECLMECAGTCTPTTQTSTTVVLVSATPLYAFECKLRFGSLDDYILTRLKYKRTVTTTTTNSDCSQTVSTTVTYIYVTCWSFFAQGCFYPQGSAFGFC